MALAGAATMLGANPDADASVNIGKKEDHLRIGYELSDKYGAVWVCRILDDGKWRVVSGLAMANPDGGPDKVFTAAHAFFSDIPAGRHIADIKVGTGNFRAPRENDKSLFAKSWGFYDGPLGEPISSMDGGIDIACITLDGNLPNTPYLVREKTTDTHPSGRKYVTLPASSDVSAIGTEVTCAGWGYEIRPENLPPVNTLPYQDGQPRAYCGPIHTMPTTSKISREFYSATHYMQGIHSNTGSIGGMGSDLDSGSGAYLIKFVPGSEGPTVVGCDPFGIAVAKAGGWSKTSYIPSGSTIILRFDVPGIRDYVYNAVLASQTAPLSPQLSLSILPGDNRTLSLKATRQPSQTENGTSPSGGAGTVVQYESSPDFKVWKHEGSLTVNGDAVSVPMEGLQRFFRIMEISD